MMYGNDLAYVHHAGFSEYARRTAPEIVRLLTPRRGISPAIRGGSLIVEFGCGGGTTARYLTDHGFRVYGVDQSPAMVKLARLAAPRARFAVGSLATTPIPRCAAIIALGEVVNYLPGRRSPAGHDRDVFRFFARAARALEPGGLLLFDFMESAKQRTFHASTRSGDDWAVVASASADGQILTRHVTTVRHVAGTMRLSQETHRVRLYSRHAMTAALRRAGFVATMRRFIGRIRVIRGDLVAFASAD